MASDGPAAKLHPERPSPVAFVHHCRCGHRNSAGRRIFGNGARVRAVVLFRGTHALLTLACSKHSQLKLMTAVFADPETIGLGLFAFTAEAAEKPEPVLEEKNAAAALSHRIIFAACLNFAHNIAVIAAASWTCHICFSFIYSVSISIL